jgi:hypothetical protein
VSHYSVISHPGDEYHFTSNRMIKIKRTTLSVDKYVEQHEISYFPNRIITWCYHFGKEFDSFYEIKLSQDLEVPTAKTPQIFKYIHTTYTTFIYTSLKLEIT